MAKARERFSGSVASQTSPGHGWQGEPEEEARALQTGRRRV